MAKAQGNTATRAAATPADKAKRFKEIGSKRVGKAIASIQSIGKLANKSSYEYTPEQAEKIVTALQEETAKVKEAFAEGKAQTTDRFEL